MVKRPVLPAAVDRPLPADPHRRPRPLHRHRHRHRRPPPAAPAPSDPGADSDCEVKCRIYNQYGYTSNSSNGKCLTDGGKETGVTCTP